MDGWNQAEASLILSSKLMNADQDGIPMNQQPESAKLSAKTPISVLIPVKNEAENLRRSLPALTWADEIWVIDSQSTDDTAAVAAEFGAKLVQFHFNGVYPKKKNWALDHLEFANDWVLIVDADEVAPPDLVKEIQLRVAANEADGFFLNMKYFFLGRRIKHCGYNECWNLRLFRHKLGRYEKMPVPAGVRTGDNEAHEHVILNGPVKRLTHELDHHAYPSLSIWLEKHDRYAAWEAVQRSHFRNDPIPPGLGRGKTLKRMLKKIYLRMPLRPLIRFIYAYIFRLGFLDGMAGLYFCGLLAFYEFLIDAKAYEMKVSGQE